MSETESNSIDHGDDTEMSDTDVKFDCQDCLCKMDPFPGQDTLTSFEDEDPFCKGVLDSSTPLKRRSVSLIDIRNVGNIHKSMHALCTSTDTIATNSSFSKSKDSGYHQTGSLLSFGGDHGSLNRSVCKSLNNYHIGDFEDSRKLLSSEELWKELEFNRVLIRALQENNINLKLKNAEAENKINELRLQTSLHCGCCSRKSSSKPTPNYLESNSGVHPLFRKLVRQPFERKPRPMSDIYEFRKGHSFPFSVSQSSFNNSGLQRADTPKYTQTDVLTDSGNELSSDDSQTKVLRWQDSIFRGPLDYSNSGDVCETFSEGATHNLTYKTFSVNKGPSRLSPLPAQSSFSGQDLGSRPSSSESPSVSKFRPRTTSHKVYSLLDLQSTQEKVRIEERIRQQIKSITGLDKGGPWTQERNSSSEESCGLVGELITREKKSKRSDLLRCLNEADQYATTLLEGLSAIPQQLETIKFRPWH